MVYEKSQNYYIYYKFINSLLYIYHKPVLFEKKIGSPISFCTLITYSLFHFT